MPPPPQQQQQQQQQQMRVPPNQPILGLQQDEVFLVCLSYARVFVSLFLLSLPPSLSLSLSLSLCPPACFSFSVSVSATCVYVGFFCVCVPDLANSCLLALVRSLAWTVSCVKSADRRQRQKED
jgi:hypothetical protein